MKLTVLSLVLAIASTFFSTNTFSQISIQSTKGYSVIVNIQPEEIVPSTKNCQWGYNYNIRFSYAVTMTGTNKPKSLYTLQGNIGNKSVSHFFQIPTKEGTGTSTTRSNVWRGVSDCATANLATMNLSTIDIQIAADGINNQVVSFPLVIALPVKLVSFTAELDKSVKLKWSTAMETNNDFFTIERSTDDGPWTAIRKVKGAGNTSSLTNYETYDEVPAHGTSYYRLAQTDIDGTTTYSEIKTVNNNIAGKTISIFPVPLTGNKLNLSGVTDLKNTDVTILNAGGHILLSLTLTKASIDLPPLVSGVYFVRVKNKISGEAASLRFVKI